MSAFVGGLIAFVGSQKAVDKQEGIVIALNEISKTTIQMVFQISVFYFKWKTSNKSGNYVI